MFAGSVIVVDDGRTVFEKGYGWADRVGVRRPNAPDTLYRIGSVSKQFTAAGILALASDRKLSLDDAVAKWFPDYPRESLSRDGVDATIHHLLAHTSGIADGQKSAFYEANRWRRPLAPDAIIEAAHSLPMVATPGTTSAVSDYGYLLLGRIIEKASGKTYESFLRERFWAPQGMHDTGTILPPEKQDRAAIGYEMAGSRFYALAEQSAFGDPDCTLAFGYGQVYSSVRDLAIWDRALTADRALPKVERERLFEPNLADYGYGWRIERKGDLVVQWHDGALLPLGFTSYVARIPAKDRFVALLTNLDQEAIAPFERQVAALSGERSKRGVTYGVAPR
ncbi:MAG: beta-lactamase family protein [Deltaproteobacteria bacterium]|nr:beta-lactamase family protein [Deltaproteobacteria bacterium]